MVVDDASDRVGSQGGRIIRRGVPVFYDLISTRMGILLKERIICFVILEGL
jgi:hypothetical protein